MHPWPPALDRKPYGVSRSSDNKTGTNGFVPVLLELNGGDGRARDARGDGGRDDVRNGEWGQGWD